MDQLTGQAVGQGAQPDVRMRTDIQADSRWQDRRPELVEEDERPDGTALTGRERPENRKSTNLPFTRIDDQGLHVFLHTALP